MGEIGDIPSMHKVETSSDSGITENSSEISAKMPDIPIGTETEQSVELSQVRRQLSAHTKPEAISLAPKTETKQTKENPRKRVKDALGKASWNTRLATTMLIQLGGLHPSRSNGSWVWVLEPWARWNDDPRQRPFSSSSDKYFESFKEHPGRVLNLKQQGYDNPTVTLDGFGGIQLLDHTRIHEARNAGKGIVVNVDNLRGAPKTYN